VLAANQDKGCHMDGKGPKYRLYEIVIIESKDPEYSELNGLRGVIMSEDQDREDGLYSVHILSEKHVEGWILREEDLESTGKFALHDDFYSGAWINVEVDPITGEGRIIEHGKNHGYENDNVNLIVNLTCLAETGKLDGLPCPKCGVESVSVWFTQPTEDEYRTWFICEKCDFRTRAQNSERPLYFRPDRIDKELQIYDEGIVRERKFPPPSDMDK